MTFIEAPTTFYMGRRYEPTSQRLTKDVVYYDSRDLTTHAVCVGMTGSGKTGLCINLLEEAVLDNIPSIIIDPKGDITNLLLSFPDMQPADFAPWINVDEARRAHKDVGEYAADVAGQWKEGLSAWGIVPDRVRWLKHAAEYNIYTPGSDAGLPISILDAMQAPSDWYGQEEAHRERINGIVTALLALIGKQVEPVKDIEHVLIANIFENAWKQGLGLTLEDVIIQVQQPPFAKLGVFDVDKVISEKERFKLAMALNNIIAAPSFQSWVTGRPLDVKELLYTPEGKPRVSVFYIAHLNDAERQFIITLLLENILAWMRTLSGTTSLRALLYMDEIYGLFPPYPKNPPTKDPMLKLLKQARAFGLGVVLATQNPGDLDYKGLANCGTWFIGKLQTENDRKKMLAGLDALADAQPGWNVKDVADIVSELDPRVFLMHNVHDEAGPQLFHTRWAMSYLRGPLTRRQVSKLMAPMRTQMPQTFMPAPGSGGFMAGAARPQAATIPEPPLPPGSTPTGTAPPMHLPEVPGQRPQAPSFLPGATSPSALPGTPPPAATDSQMMRQSSAPAGYTHNQPVVPSSIQQYFLANTIPVRTAIANWERQYGFSAHSFGGGELIYKPFLMAQASIRFQDRKTNLNTDRAVAYHVPQIPKVGFVRWEDHQSMPVESGSISHEPFAEAMFTDLPSGFDDAKRLKELQREVIDQIYHSINITLLYSSSLKLYSSPDDGRRDFVMQVQGQVRERRDEEIDKVAAKYDTKLNALETKLRREVRELEEDRAEHSERRREHLFTAGEAALSLFKGRTTYTLSRYSRTRRYSREAEADILESEEEIAVLERSLDETAAEMERALQAVNDKWIKIAGQVEEYRINPLKKNIYLELFGIGWIPYWYTILNNQPVLLPANAIAARE